MPVTRRSALAFCVVALTAIVGRPDDLWAQKGVADVTLAPGASASLYFKVYCVEFGMPLTKEPLSFKGRSEHDVADILHYAHWKGYVETDPVQVQLAIWKRKTGEWKAANHAIAEDILNNASQSPAKASQGSGHALIARIGDGQMTFAQPRPRDGRARHVDDVKVRSTTRTDPAFTASVKNVRDGFELAAPHDHMTGYVTSHRVHD